MVVQTVPDFIAFLLFGGVVKNGIQYFFLKDLAGGGAVAYLKTGNTEKKNLTSSILAPAGPFTKGLPRKSTASELWI